MNEPFQLAHWAGSVQRSALQNLLSRASEPDILSFGLGLPDPQLFPTQMLARVCAETLANDRNALQYAPPSQSLKQHVVRLMSSRGVTCTESQIFLTAGAQQGLSLLARLLVNSHDTVMLEEHSYSGFLQAVQTIQPKIAIVSSDIDNGVNIDDIEAQLQLGVRPALVYTIPEGHNPLGSSMSEDNRHRLVHLARKWKFPIVEDDAYGFLQYDNSERLPLRALEQEFVLYVGSFAKILAPSLRVGWLVVPERLIMPLSALKESTDIEIATFTQRIVCGYLDNCNFLDHINLLRDCYRKKRDRMYEALRSNMPISVRASVPRSGIFLWADLGNDISATGLLHRALADEHLAFVPGSAFSPFIGGADNCVRLNYSHPAPGDIDEGMIRLARLLKSV